MSDSRPDLGFTHVWQPAPDPTGADTLLLLHGTGGDENDLVPLARMLKPDAAVLSPRGRVLEQGMPRFFRRLAEGVFDLEDLRVRTLELGDFVEAAAREYGFDASRVTAVGFSNGANVAASLMLRRPGLLRSAILLRAMVPFEPDPPLAADALAGTRIFMSSGRQDPIIPPANSQRLAELFTAAGAEVQLEWQDGGHGLVQRDVQAARGWLDSR
jgi:phospholipase/carboxylesterase